MFIDNTTDSATASTLVEDDRLLLEEIQQASSLDEVYSARNALMRKYLDLTRQVARQVVPKHLRGWEDDCCQEAACALLQVASRFSPHESHNFPSYVWGAMRNRILSYLRSHNHRPSSERLSRNIARVRRAQNRSDTADLYELSDEALARATGLTLVTVRNLRPWLEAPVPVDGLTESQHDIGETDWTPQHQVASQSDHEQLLNLLGDLDFKDRYLVERVFGLNGEDPISIRQAVCALGFSPQRGAVRLKRALRVLRAAWRE